MPPWSTIFLLVGGVALVLGVSPGPRSATMFGSALLARAEAKHANLLVDVPPRPDGRLDVRVTPLRH